MHAVKSINFELESWFGIWNFGVESEIFYKKPWDFESYTRFQLGVGPLDVNTMAMHLFRNNDTFKCLKLKRFSEELW